jgi:hypothetical protein
LRGVRSTFITNASRQEVDAEVRPDARGGELLDLDVGLGAGKLGL